MPDDERTIRGDTEAFDELFAIEPLHPDLVPHLVEGSISPLIHHPLVISTMHHERLNKQVNRRYVTLKAELEKALADEKWGVYVFLHERPYRFDALMEIMDPSGFWDEGGDGAEYWKLISDVWTDSENINQHFEGWCDLWASEMSGRELVMDEEERAALAALPDLITVWRGAGHPGAAEGLSWTLNKEKAAWFARRNTGHPDRVGAFVARGAVRKCDVLAHFIGRDEAEIVVLPDHVTNVKVQRIADRKR
jgi:hypothetical protein